MIISIPGRPVLDIRTIVLDLNGTLTVDGELLDGVHERIYKLKQDGLEFRIFSGDTQGTGTAIATILGVPLHITKDGKTKLEEAEKLDLRHITVIGNGKIDFDLFRKATLRICVLQEEGTYGPLLAEADIVVKNIRDALDLFCRPKRLIATLRN